MRRQDELVRYVAGDAGSIMWLEHSEAVDRMNDDTLYLMTLQDSGVDVLEWPRIDFSAGL